MVRPFLFFARHAAYVQGLQSNVFAVVALIVCYRTRFWLTINLLILLFQNLNFIIIVICEKVLITTQSEAFVCLPLHRFSPILLMGTSFLSPDQVVSVLFYGLSSWVTCHSWMLDTSIFLSWTSSNLISANLRSVSYFANQFNNFCFRFTPGFIKYYYYIYYLLLLLTNRIIYIHYVKVSCNTCSRRLYTSTRSKAPFVVYIRARAYTCQPTAVPLR